MKKIKLLVFAFICTAVSGCVTNVPSEPNGQYSYYRNYGPTVTSVGPQYYRYHSKQLCHETDRTAFSNYSNAPVVVYDAHGDRRVIPRTW